MNSSLIMNKPDENWQIETDVNRKAYEIPYLSTTRK